MRILYCIAKAILLVIFLQLVVNQELYAQNDSFFNYNNNEDKRWRNLDEVQAPALPYSHGLSEDYSTATPVPIGGVMRFLFYYQ